MHRVIVTVLGTVLAAQATVTPATFRTKAQVSAGAAVLSLSSAVATIEPRLNAPGYRWLRVYFYPFALTAAEAAAAATGSVDGPERRRKSSAGSNPAAYNLSNAVFQLSVDNEGKVWQIDLSVPGHSCTIAASAREATARLQDYRFDGAHLRLKTKGTHVCERFAWDVDLTAPVFATGVAGR